MANVLILMETSGALRRRFQARGHVTISVDLLPAEDVANGILRFGGHWQGDVFDVYDQLHGQGWQFDALVAHPECTHLTNSAAWAFKDPDFKRYPGVGYHQRVQPGTLTGGARRSARAAALRDVRKIDAFDVPVKIFENPIGAIIHAFDGPLVKQIVQPYQFGDDASKDTVLIYRGLGPMTVDLSKHRLPGRMYCKRCRQCTPYMEVIRAKGCFHCGNEPGLLLPRWSNQTDSGQNNLGPRAERWKDRSRTYPGIADALVAHVCKTIEVTP